MGHYAVQYANFIHVIMFLNGDKGKVTPVLH